MAEKANAHPRPMTLAVLLAAGVTVVAAFLIMPAVMYERGAESGRMGSLAWAYGRESYGRLDNWLLGQPAFPSRVAAYGSGTLFAFLLSAMRLRFVNWPFHPLGFALASSWYLSQHTWAPIFLGWLLKTTILRYGGRRAYRACLPFFVGLVLGDCVWGSLLAFLGILLNTRTYSVWL